VSDAIDYYFSCASPFVYLGHRALLELADKHGKKVNFKPFNIADVWAESGSVPIPQRSAVRQRYRLIELQRIAHIRGLGINIHPAHFPTDPTRADLCCTALVLAGQSPASFLQAVGQALWENEQQIADDAVLRQLLSDCGHDADAVMQAADGPEAAARRTANSQDAVAADAIGAPTYVYAGEVFWGQDRLDYLDAMLSSGRQPFSA
jgi:2-hydroxychromene-2-carboxylate isomerase